MSKRLDTVVGEITCTEIPTKTDRPGDCEPSVVIRCRIPPELAETKRFSKERMLKIAELEKIDIARIARENMTITIRRFIPAIRKKPGKRGVV